MLIDNKVDRYPGDGFDIKTVWDFINEFSGKKSQQTGNLDIVTGYFTIRALSKLYHDIPEEDNFRIVSSELVKPEEDESQIIDLLRGDGGISTTLHVDQYAEDAKAFLRRNTVQVRAIVNSQQQSSQRQLLSDRQQQPDRCRSWAESHFEYRVDDGRPCQTERQRLQGGLLVV